MDDAPLSQAVAAHVADIQAGLARAAGEAARDYWRQLPRDLLQQASAARNNNEQNALFETLEAVRRSPRETLDALCERLARPAAVAAPPRRPVRPAGGLALVDTGSFDDEAVVADLVHRLENPCRELLFDLQRHCTELEGRPLLWERLDIGPARVVPALVEGLIDSVRPDPLARRLMIEWLRVPLLLALQQVYRGEAARLLAAVREFARSPAAGDGGHGGDGAPSQPDVVAATRAADPPRQGPPRPPEVAHAPPVAMSFRPAASVQQAVDHSDVFAGPPPVAAWRGEPTPIRLDGAAQRRARVFATAQRMLHGSVESPPPVQPVPSAHDDRPPAGDGSDTGSAVLLDGLARWQARPARWRKGSPEEFLDKHHREQTGEPLRPHERMAITGVDQLVAGILGDGSLSERAQRWIQRLQLPMLRAALQDETWFSRDAAPARALINQIGRLDSLLRGSQSAALDGLLAAVDVLLERLASDPEGSADLLHDAERVIDSLVQSHAERQHRREAELAGRLDQDEARQRDAWDVEALLVERFGERLLPPQVPQLLDAGWRTLLQLAWRNRDAQPREWDESLRVLDVLADAEAGRARAAVLPQVERGLRYAGLDDAQIATAVASLARGIAAPAGDGEAVRYHAPASVGMPTGNDAAGVDAGSAEDPAGSHWLRFVAGLAVGTALRSSEADGTSTLRRIVWINAERSALALADPAGAEVERLSMASIARRFAHKTIAIEAGDALPLLDQGLYRMFQQAYGTLLEQARRDELTGLLKRREFIHEVQALLLRAERRPAWLGYLDIDDFRLINSICGLEGGDALLRQVSRAVGELVGASGLAGRLANDEFGFVIDDGPEAAAIARVQGLLDALAKRRFEWDGTRHAIEVSIGLRLLSGDVATTLLQQADTARTAARQRGGHRLHLYSAAEAPAPGHDLIHWLGQVNDVLSQHRLALRAQRIQPVGAADLPMALPHYEVLLGVVDAQGRVLPPPERFIAAAETHHRMQAIDRWVVDGVLTMMCQYPAALDGIDGLSINLSGASLGDPEFRDFLFEQLYRPGLRRDKLCFEVTETAAIDRIDRVVDFIHELKQAGCRFSLDDFGTGLASYGYLKRLPVDYIKIDGSFVKEMSSNAYDYALVRSINEVAHFMGKQVIAECVETEAVLAMLAEIGVDFVQGYAIERPTLLALALGTTSPTPAAAQAR